MEKRRFRFLKKLSEGTFGKVYLAQIITDSKFSKVVAIKLLHAKWADHDEIIKRSRDEARVLGRLQHRNIIKVEGLISIGGKCAIIMEYLNGVDLKTLINYCTSNRIRIPRKVIFEMVSSVASALDAAYNRPPLQGGAPLRLIHRDIKPSNIMMTVEADIKVLDFGTAQAKFEDREAETQALAFGSAAYMSPERFLGDEDRLSGDVYALGVTLYELLYQGRYGKANVRQEQYFQEQERRLEKLDLEDFSDAVRTRILNLLRGMLQWEEAKRPTLDVILQETEELAQLINDGSLKLFCRDVVEKCKISLEDPNAKPDPMENEVLFEDGSESFPDVIEQDADVQSSISFPPPIPVADVRSSQQSAVEDPDITVNLESTESEVEDTIKLTGSGIQNLQAQLEAQEAQKQKASEVETREQKKTAKSNPSKVGSKNSTQKSSLPMIIMGGLALLILGGGAGYWFISQPKGPPVIEPTVVENVLPAGKGGLSKTLGAEPTRVVLKVQSSQDVVISLKHNDFEYEWNGEGEIELKGIAAGSLRSTVQRKDEKDLRDRVSVQSGKDCTYVLNLNSGEDKWSEECSE